MQRQHIRLTAVALICGIVSTAALVKAQKLVQTPTNSAAVYKLVFRIGGDTKALPYSRPAENAIDTPVIGPVALSVKDNGDFIITNQADNSVTTFSRASGALISEAKFADATALLGAVETSGRIYAIDSDGIQSRILAAPAIAKNESLINMESRSEVAAILPEDVNAARISTRDGLALETSTGDRIRLDGSTNVQASTLPVVAPGNAFAPNANQVRISVGRKSVSVHLANPVAQAFLLGVLRSGEFYVYIVEFAGSQDLALDHKVLHFSTAGVLIDQARVPADERLFPVPSGTALAPTGGVYSLIPRENGDVDIVQLSFMKSLPTLIPKAPIEDLLTVKGTSSVSFATITSASLALPQLTRSQIQSNAAYLAAASATTSVDNITNPSGCTRAVPTEFTKTNGKYNAGSYPEAYAWGKSDLPDAYQRNLQNGYLAGNNQGADATGCKSKAGTNMIAGTDCSGFVGNALQLYGHLFYTGNIETKGVVQAIDRSALASGDILNKSGDHGHMVIFDRSDNNSLWVWEATGGFGGKVGHFQHQWTDFPSSGYTAYRYRGLIVPAPTAHITAISPNGIAYENSSTLFQVNPGQRITFSLDSSKSTANSGQIVTRRWTLDGSNVSSSTSTSVTLGAGLHKIALDVTNSEGGVATASLIIAINEVVIVPPPRIDGLNPSYVRRGFGTWIIVTGVNLKSNMTVRVRTATGGPWAIASSGVDFRSSSQVRVYVVMNGSGTFTAYLDITQNGVTASRSFTVGP